MKGNQGVFNLITITVVTKGLFNLDLEEREPRGFSTSILAVATKGLFNLDLSCGLQKVKI